MTDTTTAGSYPEEPHHNEAHVTVGEAMTDEHAEQSGNHDVADHAKVYQNMMDKGFFLGLPVGSAAAMFVALLLLGVSFIVSLFLAFLTWLGMLGFAKTFFAHGGADH